MDEQHENYEKRKVQNDFLLQIMRQDEILTMGNLCGNPRVSYILKLNFLHQKSLLKDNVESYRVSQQVLDWELLV